MKIGFCSHEGCVREINQDNFWFSLHPPILMAVADGMGGHKAGEVASSLAIETVKQMVGAGSICVPDIFAFANQKILNYACQHNETCSGMGTTLSLGILRQNELYIGHVGDSRIYLIREGQIIPLTKDHSLVAELVEMGQIMPEQVENHPQRHIITRALGTSEHVQVDERQEIVLSHDIVVFCTDGLTNLVHDEEIKEILCSSASLQDGAEQLVNMANQRGGPDNITIVCGMIEACDIEKR